MRTYFWRPMVDRWLFLLRFIPLLFAAVAVFVFVEVASATTADLEQHVHRLVNEHRAAQGLTPLTFSPEISTIARRHSQAMATGRVGVGHEGVKVRQQEIAGFIKLRGIAENVAANREGSARAGDMAVADWLSSLGHRRNIEGSYDLTGVGITQGPSGTHFFTQLFIRTPSFRPGTARRETTYQTPAPTPREIPHEPRTIETSPSTYKKPYQRPRNEKDPRKRPGRKRTAAGWVQELD